MAKPTILLAAFCSPNEEAYAASHPGTRFGLAVDELRKAVTQANAAPGPGQPNARKRGLLLDAAILSKEDAYWGAQQTIDALSAAA